MEMKFGVIAARMPLGELLAALRECGANLSPMRPLARLEEVPADGEFDYMAAGERDGAAYIVDLPMLLSVGNSDLLAAVAQSRRTLVVGCGAEAISGSFWFQASEGPVLRRLFWMCRAEIGEPFSAGVTVASEAEQPLDGDPDGAGILAALDALGFDFEGWRRSGPYELLAFEGADEPLRRPLEDAVDEHCVRYAVLTGELPAAKELA